ncbi:MAG: type II secretion system protein GspG [Planctomycetota bacterium]|nr:MAG: type II secretion system protein GspG [Planctomycetota bacterium]
MERKDRRGFTLVELMVVIVIIGILAGVVVMNYTGHDYEARKTRVKADFKIIADAIMLYKLHTGRYPEKMEDLIEQSPDAKNWKGPYLQERRLPRDPWEEPYVYTTDSIAGSYEYELISYGSDREEGGTGEAKDLTNHDEDLDEMAREYME